MSRASLVTDPAEHLQVERLRAALHAFVFPPAPPADAHSFWLVAVCRECIVGRGETYEAAVAEAIAFEVDCKARGGCGPLPEDPEAFLQDYVAKLQVFRLTCDDLDALDEVGALLECP